MQKLYTHNKYSKFRKLDNEISIFNTKTYEYISLDEVGTDIWDFIKSPKSFDSIFCHIKNIYDVKDELLTKDLENWLEEALKRRLVNILED